MDTPYIEKHIKRETREHLRKSQKRMLCDSLLLGYQIIKKQKNVWDLVMRGIVDEDDELITCVRILTTTKGEELRDKLQFAFTCGYPSLEEQDYEEIVSEYEDIKAWLEDEDSQI